MPPLNPPMDSEVRGDELIIEVRAIWHWSAKTSMAKGFLQQLATVTVINALISMIG